MKKNSVYIATSKDGFIATLDGGIDWLMDIPNPNNLDYGYGEFMSSIDALIMGRKTYEKVLSFDGEWPYDKKVFVLSQSLISVDPKLQNQVEIINGGLNEILNTLHQKGHENLYIDGGKTIQSFLKEDLIDEMIISEIPKTLTEGIPLFENTAHEDRFELDSQTEFENGIVQSIYKRV
ncbi:MAG: dihydrofolate reductase family protein [Pseudomonadota bacterium]